MTDKEIMERYKFFRPERPVSEGLMCFGFECEEGWFPLLVRLFDKIKKIRKKSRKFEVMQVKEKYASLRVNCECSTDEIEKLIDKAETESLHTCEVCGEKGSIHHKGTWYKTLCDKHGKERGYDRCQKTKQQQNKREILS